MLAKNVLKYRFCTKSIDKVIGTVNSETADKDIRPTVVRTYPLSEVSYSIFSYFSKWVVYSLRCQTTVDTFSKCQGGQLRGIFYFTYGVVNEQCRLPKRLDASLEDSMSEHWMLRESTRNLMSQLKRM